MSKTGPEIRHDAKERMKKYRAEMIAKGYISTTIFLSQEHRAELKRLGDEHRLTRAEAAEHILQIYLQSNNTNITQTRNINKDYQAETRANIKALEARLKTLEEKGSKQAETIENPAQPINPERQTLEDVPDHQTEEPAKPIQKIVEKDLDLFSSNESKPDIPEIGTNDMPEPVEPKPEQNTDLPDYLIGVDPNMPIEERHKIILRMEKDFPRAKGIPQKRIDMLNAAGILLNGKSWEKTKQFTDQLNIARRWAKKQETKK